MVAGEDLSYSGFIEQIREGVKSIFEKREWFRFDSLVFVVVCVLVLVVENPLLDIAT